VFQDRQKDAQRLDVPIELLLRHRPAIRDLQELRIDGIKLPISCPRDYTGKQTQLLINNKKKNLTI
jgi:hypothetical protein